MKKTAGIVVAVAMVATFVSGAFAEDKVTGDVYVGPASKYVFRGIDLSANKMVIQGGADISYKNFTLSYWSNLQTHAGGPYNSSDITETDITLNYAFSPMELISMNVGNILYSLEGARDTNELYLKTTLNTLLSPTLSIYWDYDEARNAGLFYTLSVGHTFELAKDIGLNLGALASYNQKNYSASENYNNLHNYELSASIDYTIMDKIKITPSIVYSNAFNKAGRTVVDDECVSALKVSYNF